MKKHLKILSSLLVVSFLLQEMAFAAVDIDPAQFSFLPRPLLSTKIPRSVAFIEDRHRGTGEKSLILIQNAHTNESCQRNLAQALDLLLKKEKIRYVFLEAGTGDDSLSFVRPLAPLERRKRVADSYLRKGKLSGFEYLDLVSDHSFTLWGAEEKKLYWEAIDVYRSIVQGREEFQDYLQKVQAAIQVLKPRIYNHSLLRFDQKRDDYLKEKLSQVEYLSTLSETALRANLDLSDYPHLERLSAFRKKEETIDFQKANEEQQKAVSGLPREALDELFNSPYSPFKVSSGDWHRQKAFYALLEEKLGDLSPYPELQKFIDYLKETDKLNMRRILEEENLLEERLYDALSKNEDERSLRRSDKILWRTKKLFGLSLTPSEFSDYRRLSQDFGIVQMTGFLNRKIMDLRQYYEESVFLKEGFEVYAEKAERFYGLTLLRDKAIVENLLKKMDEENESQAVLITGGYHGPNLKRILKDRKISYVSITPQVLNETNHARYEKILFERANQAKNTSRRASTTHAVDKMEVLPIKETGPFGFGDLVRETTLTVKPAPGKSTIVPAENVSLRGSEAILATAAARLVSNPNLVLDIRVLAGRPAPLKPAVIEALRNTGIHRLKDFVGRSADDLRVPKIIGDQVLAVIRGKLKFWGILLLDEADLVDRLAKAAKAVMKAELDIGNFSVRELMASNKIHPSQINGPIGVALDAKWLKLVGAADTHYLDQRYSFTDLGREALDLMSPTGARLAAATVTERLQETIHAVKATQLTRENGKKWTPGRLLRWLVKGWREARRDNLVVEILEKILLFRQELDDYGMFFDRTGRMTRPGMINVRDQLERVETWDDVKSTFEVFRKTARELDQRIEQLSASNGRYLREVLRQNSIPNPAQLFMVDWTARMISLKDLIQENKPPSTEQKHQRRVSSGKKREIDKAGTVRVIKNAGGTNDIVVNLSRSVAVEAPDENGNAKSYFRIRLKGANPGDYKITRHGEAFSVRITKAGKVIIRAHGKTKFIHNKISTSKISFKIDPSLLNATPRLQAIYAARLADASLIPASSTHPLYGSLSPEQQEALVAFLAFSAENGEISILLGPQASVFEVARTNGGIVLRLNGDPVVTIENLQRTLAELRAKRPLPGALQKLTVQGVEAFRKMDRMRMQIAVGPTQKPESTLQVELSLSALNHASRDEFIRQATAIIWDIVQGRLDGERTIYYLSGNFSEDRQRDLDHLVAVAQSVSSQKGADQDRFIVVGSPQEGMVVRLFSPESLEMGRNDGRTVNVPFGLELNSLHRLPTELVYAVGIFYLNYYKDGKIDFKTAAANFPADFLKAYRLKTGLTERDPLTVEILVTVFEGSANQSRMITYRILLPIIRRLSDEFLSRVSDHLLRAIGAAA